MSTGNVESFAGTIADIGPMYPFVGSETMLFIIGLASWLLWHIIQFCIEKRELNEKVAKCDEIIKDRLVADISH